MKYKIEIEKFNNQAAETKANATIFLFLPTAHFLKTNIAQLHKWNIWFCPTHKSILHKSKRVQFCLPAVTLNY